MQTETRVSVRGIMSYISSTVRVTISDGRKLTGRFDCVDKDLNIILNHATEERRIDSGSSVDTRNVGIIMIPGKELVKFEVREK